MIETITPTSGVLIGGIVAVAMGAFEVAKVSIARVRRSNGNASVLTTPEKEALFAVKNQCKDCREWHGATDTDGTPMGWIPRRWGTELHTISDSLQVFSGKMEIQTRLLEEIRDALKEQRQ